MTPCFETPIIFSRRMGVAALRVPDHGVVLDTEAGHVRRMTEHFQMELQT